jgi:endonuclease-3
VNLLLTLFERRVFQGGAALQLSLWPDAPILPHIRDSLLRVHGPQQDRLRLQPTAQFVAAMLSSRTYDAISRGAFEKLWQKLGSWDLLPDIQPVALLPYVGNVTYAESKVHHLVRSSRIIRARRSRFDIAFLADWAMEEAYSWLIPLPGVGPKVAAATLGFSTLNKRIFVVDTHVLRISKRLGLVSRDADFARGLDSLMRLVPDHWDAFDLYEMHWLMKRHGQTRCHARHPDCENCPLAALCPTRREIISGDAQRR